MTKENDILERLKHPEREHERRRPEGNILLRNILNSIFMLMAVVAMVGIVISWESGTQPVWCFVLGLLAVCVKMAEALLRMPGILKKPQHPHSRRLK